jgi:hypothetical protein
MAEDTPTAGKAWGSPWEPAELPSPAELQRQNNIGRGSGLFHVEGPPPQKAGVYDRPATAEQDEAWHNAEARLQAMRGPRVRHESEILAENARRLAEVEAQQDVDRVAHWGADPRAALRQAHRAYADAKTEIARQRQVLADAQAHREECRARMERLARLKAAENERAIRAVRESIEGRQPVAEASGCDNIGIERELEAAKIALEHAERACTDFAAMFAQTEAAEAKARGEITLSAPG